MGDYSGFILGVRIGLLLSNAINVPVQHAQRLLNSFTC